MVWSKSVTTGTFATLSFSGVIFAAMFMILGIFHVSQAKKHNLEVFLAFIVIVGNVIICGFGCLTYKLFNHFPKKIMTIVHSAFHVLTLLIIIGCSIEPMTKKLKGFLYWRKYGYQVGFIGIYLLQLILSPLLALRKAETREKTAIRVEMHTCFGILTYMYSVYIAHMEWRRICLDYLGDRKIFNHVPIHVIMIFYIIIFYINLNPYFEWRRLRALTANAEVIEMIRRDHDDNLAEGEEKAEKKEESKTRNAKTPKEEMKSKTGIGRKT